MENGKLTTHIGTALLFWLGSTMTGTLVYIYSNGSIHHDMACSSDNDIAEYTKLRTMDITPYAGIIVNFCVEYFIMTEFLQSCEGYHCRQ